MKDFTEERMWGKKYSSFYEISSHDVDVNNNLKPSILQRFLLETANHQMRDRKPTYYELFYRGQTFIMTRMCIEILEDMHQYDNVEVKTWRCPSKGATFIRCYELYREDKVVAKAYSAWAITDTINGGFLKIEDIDLSNYEINETLDMDIQTRFRHAKNLEFKPVGKERVRFSDIDMNMHLNNTYYADLLWNFIPDLLHKDVTSVNIRYMKEAPLGSELDIYMAETMEAPKGDSRADMTYSFISKIDGEINVEAQIGMRSFDRADIVK